jgi:hypothetical protein
VTVTTPGSLLSIADRTTEELVAFIDQPSPIRPAFAESVAVVVDLPHALPHLESIVHEGVARSGACQVRSSLTALWAPNAPPPERISTMRIIAAITSIGDDGELRSLDQTAPVPILNGGSDGHRPLQILADLLVLKDLLGPLRGRTMVITDGDGAYVTSWVQAAVRVGLHLELLPSALPERGLAGLADEVARADLFGSRLTISHDASDALRHADVIVGMMLLPRRDPTTHMIELPIDLSGAHAQEGGAEHEGARTLLFHRVERAKDVVAAFIAGRC